MVKTLPTEEFLVSFLVDARGGYMQAQRLPQLKIFVPPDAAPSPTRIICHLLKPDRLNTLPELNDCDGFASRILQIHSSCPRFQKPIVIEVPHIASLRNGEREVIVMRKNFDNPAWKEHMTVDDKDNLKETFGEFYDLLTPEEELETNRIRRIVTTDIPNYFCLVSRFQRDSNFIGQEGGSIESKVDNRIKIRFPPGALMKKIQISLEVQIVDASVVSQVLGDQHNVSVSPIITVEPKRRKFRDLIEIQMPLPKGVEKNDLSNLRILFSISEHTTQWEDVTSSTELQTQDDYVTHSTKISARVWLISAPGVENVAELANKIYAQHCCTPYIGRFLAYARRHEVEECQLRLILITDDSADKTLECQESFELIATGPEVEVISKLEYQIETAGNLVPVTKSDETIQFRVQPFLENRLTVPVRMRNHEEQFSGKIAFIPDHKSKTKQVIKPITTLDIAIPEVIIDMIASLRKPTKKIRVKNATIERIKGSQAIAKTELNLQMVAEQVGGDWPHLATELGLDIADVNLVLSESCTDDDKAFMTLIQWQNLFGNNANGNELNRALRTIGREDVIKSCMGDISFVQDADEVQSATERLRNDNIGVHDNSWDEVLKPNIEHEACNESVNESMIAETGDDWSDRNREEDRESDIESDDKSLVGSTSPKSENVAEPDIQLIVNINRDVVEDDLENTSKIEVIGKPDINFSVNMKKDIAEDDLENASSRSEVIEEPHIQFIVNRDVAEDHLSPVNKTAVFLNLMSELDKVIPEPTFPTDDTELYETEEVNEGFIYEQPVMSCMPSNMNFEFEEDHEEIISPVKATQFVTSVPTAVTNDDSESDGNVKMESCVPFTEDLDLDEKPDDYLSLQDPAVHDDDVEVKSESCVSFTEDSVLDEKHDDGLLLQDPTVHGDSVGDEMLTQSELLPEDLQKHSVLHEVFESEPQIETEVEEQMEVLPDGRVLKRKIIKTRSSHTITEKTTKEVSPEEEEQLRAMISNEPAEVVHSEVELEDGSIINRTVSTIKTSMITSKSTTEQELDAVSDDGVSSTGVVKSEDIPKPVSKSRNRKNRKNKSKSSQM